MTKRPQLIVPAIIIGIALLAVAVLYWIDAAESLPSFMPGYEAGSTHHHIKHGLAAFDTCHRSVRVRVVPKRRRPAAVG